jgi:hypothetical protein
VAVFASWRVKLLLVCVPLPTLRKNSRNSTLITQSLQGQYEILWLLQRLALKPEPVKLLKGLRSNPFKSFTGSFDRKLLYGYRSYSKVKPKPRDFLKMLQSNIFKKSLGLGLSNHC